MVLFVVPDNEPHDRIARSDEHFRLGTFLVVFHCVLSKLLIHPALSLLCGPVASIHTLQQKSTIYWTRKHIVQVQGHPTFAFE